MEYFFPHFRMKRRLICILTLFLAGCGSLANKSHRPVESFNNDIFGMAKVQFPEKYTGPFMRDDAGISFWNFNINTSKRKPGDQSIVFYKADHCSRLVSGADLNNPINTGIKANWGRVNYFDTPSMERDRESPHPLCYVMSGEKAGSYAMCSENNGKAILVCIAQFQENLQIAKQIFESFRWTDGNGSPEL